MSGPPSSPPIPPRRYTRRYSVALASRSSIPIIDETAKQVLKQRALERLKKLKEADAELASSSEDEVEIYASILPTTGNARDRNEAADLGLAHLKPGDAEQQDPKKTNAAQQPAGKNSRKRKPLPSPKKNPTADDEGITVQLVSCPAPRRGVQYNPACYQKIASSLILRLALLEASRPVTMCPIQTY
ncbi:hypothetical protein DFH27DRAFT_522725 [Peziza echinospora]|nr:hypothetical protein DFH27DRAFT_522725 [Peziza echinospora]